MRRSDPNISVHSSNGRFEVRDDYGAAFIALRDDFEEQLSAGFAQGDKAQLVSEADIRRMSACIQRL